MKATVLDLRRRMSDVLRALEHNESVTILYRGREKAILSPAKHFKASSKSLREHSVFGMWRDQDAIKDVPGYIRRLRRGRYNAI